MCKYKILLPLSTCVLCVFLEAGCIGFNVPAIISGEHAEKIVADFYKDFDERSKYTTEGKISIYSTPSGAKVFSDETYLGTTPITVLRKFEDAQKTITLRYDGYESVSFSPSVEDADSYGLGYKVRDLLALGFLGTVVFSPWLGIDYAIWREKNDIIFSPAEYSVYLIEK